MTEERDPIDTLEPPLPDDAPPDTDPVPVEDQQ